MIIDLCHHCQFQCLSASQADLMCVSYAIWLPRAVSWNKPRPTRESGVGVFVFGQKMVFEHLVDPGHKFLCAHNAAVCKVPGPVSEPIQVAKFEACRACPMESILVSYSIGVQFIVTAQRISLSANPLRPKSVERNQSRLWGLA